MKKLLLFFVLFVLLSFHSYPQSIRPDLNTDSDPFRYIKQMMSSGNNSNIMGIQTLIPGQLNGKKLNKNNGSLDIKLALFKPFTVLVDSLHRSTYSYDGFGNEASLFTEEYRDSQWVNNQKNIMSYDAQGNLLSTIIYMWRGSGWEKSFGFFQTYGSSNNILTYLSEVYDDFGFVKFSTRGAYTYDKNGNLTTELFENLMGGVWVLTDKYTNTHDPFGNILTRIYEKELNGTLVNNFKHSYTYDSKNNISTWLNQTWNAQDSSWANSSRESFSYDSSTKKILTDTTRLWQGNEWANYSIMTYSYDNEGNILSIIKENGNNAGWENSSRSLYNYNGIGQLLTYQLQFWTAGAWKENYKNIYYYDYNGNASRGECYSWQADSSRWIPISWGLEMRYNDGKDVLNCVGAVAEVKYTMVTDVENNSVKINGFSLSQNYPNPFNPSTTINYSLKKEANVKLTVFDALGKRVAVVVDEYKPAGSYSLKFDGSSLPSGMYIYRLEAGEFTAARKFILMK